MPGAATWTFRSSFRPRRNEIRTPGGTKKSPASRHTMTRGVSSAGRTWLFAWTHPRVDGRTDPLPRRHAVRNSGASEFSEATSESSDLSEGQLGSKARLAIDRTPSRPSISAFRVVGGMTNVIDSTSCSRNARQYVTYAGARASAQTALFGIM